MEIVRLGRGEEDRLRAIRLQALREAPDAFGTTLAEVLARPDETWSQQLRELPSFVATSAGRDIGMVRYASDDRCSETGWLISMWVSPESRGRGVGSALIDAVVALAASTCIKRLMLDVGDHNTFAISLYMRKGFEETGETNTLEAPRQHLREHRRILTLV